MAVIICTSCRKEKPHHARGMCKTCHQRHFRLEYFQAYRSRPEYKQQRLIYDIKYQLKDESRQKKSEMLLTFDSN